MRDTLTKAMKAGINLYNTTAERKEWVVGKEKQLEGQVIATVAQIKWCEFTEGAITEMGVNP
eukprot:CAMPEP_0176340608 /NCGR_PEP_ID=MMETSP0126-20121128/1692_1 /TAXON_ID=141414 ORGANISM="Strombidinopsis acuminatum, Strain SPMC142" /NCGR_SAMPLE_ID=MMETSP0126 /ASSEMBLY_ACC=CAM_ASM_000229 /LENGTH=61 /DNA_ID=CAMNT_0017684883 /DNA_START=775 /DNA_END=956 /DNA_ORIENTATION=+